MEGGKGKEENGASSRLQPPSENRQFTKTNSMPLNSLLGSKNSKRRSSATTKVAASDTLQQMDFSSLKLGSEFWSARESQVVKGRQGSVLTRGLVVKTDHFAGVRRPNLGVHLQGAPNFRQADIPGLQVYGAAQPTITGLKTILSVLQCAPIKDLDEKVYRLGRGRPQSPRRAGPTERASSATPRLGPAEGGKGNRFNSPDPNSEKEDDPQRKSDDYAFNDSFPSTSSRRCVWACTRNEPVIYVGSRPFVLREADQPFENFQLSERADNLESIEQRLKADILREANRYGGLLMVHEEDEQGMLKPAWVAVGPQEVKTVREVWELIRKEGWRCDYHRIPIAEDQPMENNYLDAYTQIIKDIDPLNTAFVANCGMGVRRTSFAMVAAVLVRRRQMILLGHGDPFQMEGRGSTPMRDEKHRRVSKTPAAGMAAKSLQVASEKQIDAQSTLQVVQVLNKSLLDAGSSQTAVEVLLSHPLLLDALRSAKEGNYGVIRQLVGLLDDGEDSKIAVDLAIDACSHVIHLRHSILEARVRYALAGPDLQVADNTNRSRTANNSILKAVNGLEQYHLLVTFGSYVAGSETAIFKHRFATWLRERAEISHFISRIRSKGSQLYFFDPIADLSALSKGGVNHTAQALVRRKEDNRNLVPGDEFADHVVRNRAGLVLRPLTLLKEDIWRSLEKSSKIIRSDIHVRGAVNFRRIRDSNIFATGQPTVEGIRNILRSIEDQLSHKGQSEPLHVTFINLREEPLCHINGKPYCLRQKGMSLRNIKSYSGISWSRLTLLEDRLKNDLLNELNDGDGRLLLHTETEDGAIVPIWEAASPSDVETLQDVMTKVGEELDQARIAREKGQVDQTKAPMPNVDLTYRRVPITAERPPDFSDIAAIMRTVLRSEMQSNACIVLNCQLGRGRSTMTSVIVLLIEKWLGKHKKEREGEGNVVASKGQNSVNKQLLSYHIINSLLRVIPHGLAVKQIVDDEIDRSAGVVNLRNGIEDSRLAAEDTEDENVKRSKIQSGIYNLRRYFELIVFQAYLEATPAQWLESLPTFEAYVKNQPVFHTLSHEFEKIDLSTITPLQKVETGDGMALSEEVQEVVSNRAGNILSAYTMLKSDMFPGLAAQALSQIEGIPNMRGVGAVLGHLHSMSGSNSYGGSIPPTPFSYQSNLSAGLPTSIETWGHGMPSIDGLRKGLEKIGAGPKGSLEVIATSLREEAVIVINGRPHVLRLADQPFTNVEATGITTEAVERMEEALKQDVLKEVEKYEGRILLHDEKINDDGQFEIFPVWESVKAEDVLTPKEMYQIIQSEGYKVQYARVAVTDEQAPIPAVFNEMEERVLEALRIGAACVWNCQMGRGRTTTGMVIAALVSTVAQYGEELFEPDLSASIVSWSGFHDHDGAQQYAEGGNNVYEVLDNREDELWLQGEYRSVLQLVAILKHGKLAKKLTDGAIDRMDAVQNLRKAIYDSKMRASNADSGTSKHKHLTRVYVNYLQRYSYLIVFANYLLEKSQAMLESGYKRASSVRSSSRDRFSQATNSDDDDDDDEDDDDDIRTNNDDDNQSLISTSMSTSTFSINASRFAQEESRLKFPTFVNWLQPRREIAKICGGSEDR